MLTDGTLVWDDTLNNFDWQATDALPPCLRGAFSAEPLWVDLRWARQESQLSQKDPRLQEAVADLAAPLHGRPKEDLIGEDLRQHRRTMRLLGGVVVALTALLLAALEASHLFFDQRSEALYQADIAEQRRALAESRRLAAESLAALGTDLDLALLLSLQANQSARTVEARASLVSAQQASARLVTILHGGLVPDSPDPVTPLHATAPARVLAFSPDGGLLAAAESGSYVRLWNLATNQAAGPPLGDFVQGARSVAFAPDGRSVAAGGNDRTVSVWDLQTRGAVRTVKELPRDVRSLAFSPDGHWLAFGDAGGDMNLWDLSRGDSQPTPLRGFPSAHVEALAFNPDSSQLIAGGPLGIIRAWDPRTGRAVGGRGFVPRVPLPLAQLEASVEASEVVALSPDGARMATADTSGRIRVWDTQRSSVVPAPTFAEHGAPMRSLAFSHDGRWLASGGEDRRIQLWSLATGRAVGEPFTSHPGPIRGLAFSPDDRVIAGGGELGRVQLWDASTLTSVRASDDVRPPPLTSIAFSPDAERLIALDAGGSVAAWQTASGERAGAWRLVGEPIGAPDDVPPTALSPDAALRAHGGPDGRVHVLEAASGQSRIELDAGLSAEVRALAFSGDGHRIAADASESGKPKDNVVRVWDTGTGEPIGEPAC